MKKNEDGEVGMDDYLAAYSLRQTENKVGKIKFITKDTGDWMFNPRNNFRLSWDLGLMMPLLVYLTVVLPFRLTFENEAPLFTWVYWLEFMIDLLFMGKSVTYTLLLIR
jgi:hypothetical protein